MLAHYCISYLSVGVILFGIAIFVYLKNKAAYLNRVFALYSLSIAWWSVFSIPAILSTDNTIGVYWCRTFIIGPIFIPTLFLHFTLIFLHLSEKYKRLIYFCYAVSIFFLTSNFTKLFIRASEPKFSLRSYSVPGVLFHFHVVYFAIVTIIGLLFLYRDLRSTNISSYRKQQLFYLFFGSLIGYIGGIANYLLVYRIEIPILNPFGTYTVALYGIMMAYTIVKYRLLDINLALTRAGIFILVYALVLGIPFGLMGWGKLWLIGVFNQHWYWFPMFILLGLATLGPFIYLFIQRRTENILLKDQRRYQDTLKQASIGMTRIRNLTRLLNLIAHIVTKTVKIAYVGIYLYHEENEEYLLGVCRDKGGKHLEKIPKDNPLITWLMLHKKPLLYEEIKRLKEEGTDATHIHLEENMRSLSATVIIPCLLQDRIIGFFVLGDKLSGQIYTSEDLNVFQILASQAALAIENAFFFEEAKKMQEQIAQAEKMATVGTMADGLSHQINNRFHALSLIAGDTIDTIKMTDVSQCTPEVKEMIRQVNNALSRIQANVVQGGEVVKGLLKYTRKGEEGLEPLTLDQILDGTLQMVQYKVKLSEIDVLRDYSKDIPKIKGNMNQLQEAFFNFIDNGYDSMVERKNTLKEKGYRGKFNILAYLNSELDAILEIVIADNGMGIREENKKKLFAPFFTTKISSRRGTGLGLYVIKRIIEDFHQGRIWFESEYGKGTKFFLQLPISKD